MIIEPLFLVFLVLCLILLIKHHWENRNFYALAWKIPIPDNYSWFPLVGHAHHVIGRLEELLKCTEIYGKLEKPNAMWMGPSLYVVISKPDHIEIVLNNPKCINKSKFFKHFSAVGGDGLILSNVPKWRKHRKILNPMFNQRLLDSFVEIFAKHHGNMVSTLKQTKLTTKIDILEYTKCSNFDIFLESSLGINQESNQTTRNLFLRALENGLRIAMLRIINPFYHWDPIFNLFKCSNEIQMATNTIFSICNDIFLEKLKVKENKICEDGFGESKPILLDYLVENYIKQVFTQQEVIDEVATFIAAGVETCAAEFSFICLMLAIHEDIQEKVYNEVMEVLGPEKTVTYSDLPELIYTEKAIKETMRLFPVGPFMIRQLSENIEIDDVWLPKGCEIAINVLGVQRSPNNYENPLKFVPERFDSEEIAKRNRYTYIPFSAGPRNCIGWKFAMMSLKTAVALFIREFRIATPYKSVSDIRIEQSLTINAVEGFPITLFSRN